MKAPHITVPDRIKQQIIGTGHMFLLISRTVIPVIPPYRLFTACCFVNFLGRKNMNISHNC
ncbi:Uncharacterized protein dnm_095640 [Desulfonema magnum]|uniref:Uncharacterized protein n=1 Tax=Desulfonema magnum TaxID=45655 RepID=A0A975GVE0_9BACT|nr:Uncharacterized protein dnm_095640 [Desulfonema magnum]